MSDEFYLALDGSKAGPYTLSQVQAMWREGRVNLDTQFLRNDMTEWKSLRIIQAQVEPPPPLPVHLSGNANFGAPKSRAIFILLALLFGGIGIHNLYAERWNFALMQLVLLLAIIVLTVIFLPFFVFGFLLFVWAVVECFAVTKDGKGTSFE